jgi:hypothetical protein
MMHPTIPSLFFIGLFQPIGCIWRLADYQARIAALQISGRLKCPFDIDARIRHGVADARYRSDPLPRHAIEVDYHDFRRELMGELAAADAVDSRPDGSTTVKAVAHNRTSMKVPAPWPVFSGRCIPRR